MTEKQWRRLDVIRRVIRRLLTVVAAAALLRLKPRQVRNLVKAVKEHGPKGVVL